MPAQQPLASNAIWALLLVLFRCCLWQLTIFNEAAENSEIPSKCLGNPCHVTHKFECFSFLIDLGLECSLARFDLSQYIGLGA